MLTMAWLGGLFLNALTMTITPLISGVISWEICANSAASALPPFFTIL